MIVMIGRECGTEYFNSGSTHPAYGILGRGGNHRHGKDASDAGPDCIWVIDVGLRIANDHSIEVGSIGRTQQGAKISGFFDALQNEEERRAPLLQIAE